MRINRKNCQQNFNKNLKQINPRGNFSQINPLHIKEQFTFGS